MAIREIQMQSYDGEMMGPEYTVQVDEKWDEIIIDTEGKFFPYVGMVLKGDSRAVKITHLSQEFRHIAFAKIRIAS